MDPFTIDPITSNTTSKYPRWFERSFCCLSWKGQWSSFRTTVISELKQVGNNGRVAGWVAVSRRLKVTPKRVVKKYRDPFKKAKQVPVQLHELWEFAQIIVRLFVVEHFFFWFASREIKGVGMIISLKIQICPKKGISLIILVLGMGLGTSNLL